MPRKFNEEINSDGRALDELKSLYKISDAVNALMPTNKITKIIIDHCLKRIKASQGAIFLLEEEKNFKTFIREFSGRAKKMPFHINESLSAVMSKEKKVYICNEPESDSRLKKMDLSKLGISSLLSAPLISPNGLIGSLVLFNKRDSRGFSKKDGRFLGVVAAQAAKEIENARLYEREKKLISKEIEFDIGQKIQREFLPKSALSHSECDVWGFNKPAIELSGDYYDYVNISNKRLFLSIGDVAGKGIPAALLMANAMATLRSHLYRSDKISLIDMANSLNHLIYQYSDEIHYITTIFGLFDFETRRFQYINAGHLSPLLIKENGMIIGLSDRNIIIGSFLESEYTVNEIILEANDLLFLYSDGITEASAKDDTEFGEEKLKKLLIGNRDKPIHQIGPVILKTLAGFREDSFQQDDITMVILKVKS